MTYKTPSARGDRQRLWTKKSGLRYRILLSLVLVLQVSSAAVPSSWTPPSSIVRDANSATDEQIDEFISSTNYDIQIPISSGQSALVDKQTGRIYWQSGGPAIAPHDVFGKSSLFSNLSHVKAILLSTLLWTCILTILLVQRLWEHVFTILTRQQAQWKNTIPFVSATLSFLTSLLLFISKPKFTSLTCNPYFISFLYALYLLESYTCSTRRYLENVFSQQRVEELMESLRSTKPGVKWNVRCYHYENPSWTLIRSEEDGGNVASTLSRRQIKKKIITHRATQQFDFDR